MFLAKCLLENWKIEVTVTRSFLKHILGKPLFLNDLEEIDPQLAKNLEWILDNNITEDNFITFNVKIRVNSDKLRPGMRFKLVAGDRK